MVRSLETSTTGGKRLNMLDAIVFSTWSWDTLNVPERIAIGLAENGYRVLHCEMPVSRLRRRGKSLHEVSENVWSFGPTYLGEKFDVVAALRSSQWRGVGRQIRDASEQLHMQRPAFFYSHVAGIPSLCRAMRGYGSLLVHICMDYPEPYQYELIELSDLTVVIPRTVATKLRARYGEKIHTIPQSIFTDQLDSTNASAGELTNIPHPRLGYLGPIFARVNLPLIKSLFQRHPDWHFISFGESPDLRLPNVHGVPWQPAGLLSSYAGSFDIGFMPYDCFDEKNLHCVPLKVFDYFARGLPTVSTPVFSLWEYSDLIYLGETLPEVERAVAEALSEPADSPKRQQRMNVAKMHSTRELGKKLKHIVEERGEFEVQI
jgi:glycosyltransferase involved in cell wall biosynthesis